MTGQSSSVTWSRCWNCCTACICSVGLCGPLRNPLLGGVSCCTPIAVRSLLRSSLSVLSCKGALQLQVHTRFSKDCVWICSICRCDRVLSQELAPWIAATRPITSSGNIDMPQGFCDSIDETERPCGSRWSFISDCVRYGGALRRATSRGSSLLPRTVPWFLLSASNCSAGLHQNSWHTMPQLLIKTVW